jgi:NAD(P)-dependent dehydrogenase (short-subunit alcohol dehydrogenase family)
MRLRDRAVVVTGAGGGIGRVVAQTFAAEGASLALADLDSGLDETVTGIASRGCPRWRCVRMSRDRQT